jgi:hypothetical protein
MMFLKWRWRQVALGMPTSSRVATAWRFRLDSVTWSKSMRRSLPTPERSSKWAAWLPTPCVAREVLRVGDRQQARSAAAPAHVAAPASVDHHQAQHACCSAAHPQPDHDHEGIRYPLLALGAEELDVARQLLGQDFVAGEAPHATAAAAGAGRGPAGAGRGLCRHLASMLSALSAWGSARVHGGCGGEARTQHRPCQRSLGV